MVGVLVTLGVIVAVIVGVGVDVGFIVDVGVDVGVTDGSFETETTFVKIILLLSIIFIIY